jgi:outer membrane protein assembly factor BamB
VGNGSADQLVNLVPAVSESTVFAAARNGVIEARNRLSGDPLWTLESDLPISAGPVLAHGTVLVGTSDGELHAFNTLDGALVWKAVLSSEILALPRIHGGLVVVRTSDGRLSALDEKSGATRWIQDRSAPSLSVRSLGSPAIAGELLIDGFGGGKVVAFTLTDGKPAWESTVAVPHGRSEIDRLVEMDSDPLIVDDTIYISGYQAGVAALALKDGEALWRQEQVYSAHGMAADRRSLYLTDSNSDVWRLDMRNGGDLWKQADLHQRRLSVPALNRKHVLVGDFEGWLHALAQDDGSLLGRIQIDDRPIRAAPVVYGDMVYVYGGGGALAAVAVD